MTYALDTNVLIHAWRDLLPLDIAPGFWEQLEALGQDGAVVISMEVVKELEKRDDELLEWVKNRTFMHLESEEDVQSHVGEVLLVEVNEHNPPLVDPDRPDSDGDVWVIALARARNATVVTQENSAPLAKKKAKIPDVCNALDVRCINLLAFMREVGFKLVTERSNA